MTRVGVTMRDYVFDPKDITVEAGQVEFSLVNAGAEPHYLSIAETTGPLVAKSDRIEPARSGLLSVKLRPGTYQIYCGIAPHRERRMEGTLTVR